MPAWKGHLQISLVSVPVRATPAQKSDGGQISFNQLHADCGERIRYKKVCPKHGEVTSDEIVSGYEYSKGEYVLIDPEEIKELRPKAEQRGVSVKTFVPSGAISPLYMAGKDYVLTPDGARGQQPYQLIQDVMEESQVQAIATAVLSNKEHLVLIRPLGKLLVMSVLEYASQIKPLKDLEDEVASVKHDKQQHALAKQLIAGMTQDEIDYTEFHDLYTERMKELIRGEGRGPRDRPAGGRAEAARGEPDGRSSEEHLAGAAAGGSGTAPAEDGPEPGEGCRCEDRRRGRRPVEPSRVTAAYTAASSRPTNSSSLWALLQNKATGSSAVWNAAGA